MNSLSRDEIDKVQKNRNLTKLFQYIKVVPKKHASMFKTLKVLLMIGTEIFQF